MSLALTCALIGSCSAGADDGSKEPELAPLNARPPVRVLQDAVDTLPIVLIGEYHGWTEQHHFLRELVGDPAFHRGFDDVVVEFGNARFQHVVDAYIRGEEIPRRELERVWSRTTQGPNGWQSPDYPNFFRAVRRSNGSFPKAEQLRVLLGDPPIDLSKIDGARELDLWLLQRDIHFAYVIQREILSRGRRGLVIAGASHVVRRPAPFPTLTNLLEARVECSPDPLAVARDVNWCDELERYQPARTFVVVPHRLPFGPPDVQDRLASYETPAIVPIEGSWLERFPLVRILGDSNGEEASRWTAGDAFDAYLVGL